MISFPPFDLDPSNEQLWREREPVTLKPKAFAVLRYLAERPQRLIKKEELLERFWGDVCVGDAVLKTHMAQIRRALGDDIKSPRFIETAHRRGYRFIAALENSSLRASVAPAGLASPAFSANAAAARSSLSPSRSCFVGRELELQQLEASLIRALDGPLQVVFISGEAGAGKTTLANEFLTRLEARGELWLARGQCIEQYGAGEAYLPVLEALGRLCRQRGKERIIDVLRRQAPSWLTQLPGVLDATEHAALGATASATPERMLREIAEAVLALSEERGLVLLFEDLHWADPSTLNLISYLARRSDPTRVLLLGTYRPHNLRGRSHQLVSIQQDLLVSGRGEEVALKELGESALVEYLDTRFSGPRFPPQLVKLLGERTSGNPLFLARLVDYWLEREWLVQRDGAWQLGVDLSQLVRGVPQSLARMIERELAALSEFERNVIAAASVVGVEFSVLTVAAALGVEVAKAEELCSAWARGGQFVRALGACEAPDGSVSLRCAFAHGVYQQVAYEGIVPSRLAELHLRVGAQLEENQAGSTKLIASELALHFERGRAHARAIPYLVLAAQRALSRSAYREALDHILRGLQLLPQLPGDAERSRYELQFELMHGATLAMIKGLAAPEVERSYARCKQLCTLDEQATLLPLVLEGIWTYYLVRGETRVAAEIAQQISSFAEEQGEPRLLVAARAMRAVMCCYLGRWSEARRLAERVLPELVVQHADHVSWYSEDPRVFVGGHLPWALWSLGYPDQALETSERVLALARQSGHPFTLVSGLYYRAIILYIVKDHARCLSTCDEVLHHSKQYAFPTFSALAIMIRGSVLAHFGHLRAGLDAIEAGWKVYCASGTGAANMHWIWADALALDGRFAEALEFLNEALELGQRNGNHVWDTWLYLRRGELFLQTARDGNGNVASAERDFNTTLELARAAGARSLELKAAMGLARLWLTQGKSAQAHPLLSSVYSSFDEGWETVDLREAAHLLAELSRARLAPGGSEAVRDTPAISERGAHAPAQD